MSDLQAMIARYAQQGRVDWIGLRSERRAAMQSVPGVEVTDAGLVGDHGRPGKRAVTLMQREHLAAIGAFLGGRVVRPEELRRNLVVTGLNLAGLKGRHVQIGSAVFQFMVICAPCSRMEETFGHGGYAAVRGHGGWCAQVVTPGRIVVGDVVRPV